jgi:Ca-activated chloride channel homolog
MTLRLAATWALAGAVSLCAAQETSELRILSPEADSVVSGPTRIAVAIPPSIAVQSVAFFVDGRLICTVDRPPFGCTWDAGDLVRAHHVRVVASLPNGRRLVGNVRTKDIGYEERIRVEAVLVPVIVTHKGRFVRGLKKDDFEIYEDGVLQPVASLVSEDSPLELVLAIDISGSMEDALDDVKPAVKQLLSKLRPGDAATLIGFNDTAFIAAERETDQRAREDAVELLTSWGGTALYDATISALDLVSREWGRKGVVVFSDGDDRHSLAPRDAAMARVQASDAMLYTVGFGQGGSVPALKKNLESYAHSSGGRAFFPRETKELDGVFDHIVSELANQYVLSYSPTNNKPGSAWRRIKVQVRTGKYEIRARQGYRPNGPQRAGR